MKVYARQVNPTCQESPLFLMDEIEEFYADCLIMPGNRDFDAHNTDFPAWEQITRYFDEMAGEWKNDGAFYEYDPETNRYKVTYTKKEYTLAEILKDYGFSRPDGKPWNNKQKHLFRLLMENEHYTSENEEIFLPLLRLLTGYKWETHTIRGCCQSDYADVITRADVFTREQLEAFETQYFNTGTERIIHDENDAPETPDDITGYSVYCVSWSDDEIKKEIADAAGCAPEDLVLYPWNN